MSKIKLSLDPVGLRVLSALSVGEVFRAEHVMIGDGYYDFLKINCSSQLPLVTCVHLITGKVYYFDPATQVEVAEQVDIKIRYIDIS